MFGDLLLLLVLVDLDIFVVFIDDYSRYSWIFPMKYRSEILPIYSNFAKMVETQFSKLDPTPHPLNIHIVDGSTMHGNSLGFVSTSNLSVPGVFHVPDLSYNLCSVGQLAELDYRLIFYYSGCIVQDLRMGQELGTGPRVGRIFPLDNLHFPPVAPVSVAATAAAVSSLPSLALWHSRLGHASSSQVQ